MADSMENAGSWTVSGSKEVMEVPKNFKDLQKLSISTKYSAVCPANMPFPAFCFHQHSLLPYYPHIYRSMWLDREAKPRFGAMFICSAQDNETPLLLKAIISLLHCR